MELEDVSIEIIQSEEQKEKTMEKHEQAFRSMGHYLAYQCMLNGSIRKRR